MAKLINVYKVIKQRSHDGSMEWYKLGESEIMEIYEDREYVRYLTERNYDSDNIIRCTESGALLLENEFIRLIESSMLTITPIDPIIIEEARRK
jgi:hypothetical protein